MYGLSTAGSAATIHHLFGDVVAVEAKSFRQVLLSELDGAYMVILGERRCF